MKLPAALPSVVILAVISPHVAHSQSQCTGSISFAPASPAVNQEMTITYNVNVTGAIPPGDNTGQLLYLSAFDVGYYDVIAGGGYTAGAPSSTTFSYTPVVSGTLTATGSTEPMYYYRVPNICGSQGVDLTNASFTVEVAGPPPPPPPPISLLSGQYTFVFVGTSDSAPRVANKAVAVGSLAADGNGNLSGVEDMNSAESTQDEVPISGTYTFDGSRGTMALHTGYGEQNLAFVAAGNAGRNGVVHADIFAIGPKLHGNGTLSRQDPSKPFGVTLPGEYVINLSGEAPPSVTARYVGVPIVATGTISLSAPTKGQSIAPVDVKADIYSAQAGPTQTHEVGSYTIPDGLTGRFGYTLYSPRTGPNQWVGYPLDATRFFTVSISPHESDYLLYGTASQ